MTAWLELVNDTESDYEVELDGQRLGSSLGHSVSRFRGLRVGNAVVSLKPVNGSVVTQESVKLVSQSGTKMVVPPCYAGVRVSNDRPGAVTVQFRAETREVLSGASWLWEGLTPGTHPITVSSKADLVPTRLEVSVDCGEVKELALAGSTATFVVENRLAEAVQVKLGEAGALVVPSAASMLIKDVVPGTYLATASGASGREHAREFHLVGGSTVTWVLDAPGAELELQNLVGEKLVIMRGEVPLATVAPGAKAAIQVLPGRVNLTAWCPVTGHGQEISVEVERGARLPVRVGPWGGRIRVENPVDEELWVYRNGRFLGVVPPGMEIEFAGQPLGKNLLEVRRASGDIWSSAAVDTGEKRDASKPLVLARETLDVTLENQSGEELLLDPALGEAGATIAVGARRLVRVPKGLSSIRARGSKTGLGYSVRVDRGGDTDLVVSPQVGGVRVKNSSGEALELLLDGAVVGTLQAEGSYAESKLLPGRHTLAGRRPGTQAALHSTAFELSASGWFTWTITGTTPVTSVVNKSGEGVTLSVDGGVAGALPQGAATKVAVGRDDVVVSADGGKSKQSVRVILPKGRGGDVVILGGNWGAIRVRPMQQVGDVYVDGELVQRLDGSGSELRLVAPPGERRVSVKYADGTMVERLVSISAGLESHVQAFLGSVLLTVRNETGGEISVFVDGSDAGSVSAGGSLGLQISTEPGTPLVEARSASGKRHWLLKDVQLPASGKFGWVVSE